MLRILVADPLAESGLDVLRRHDHFDLDLRNGLDGDDLRDALSTADGVIVRSGTELKSEALDGQRRLQVIVRAGVGVDNIDLEAATRSGVVVMNTPAGNTTSTAEHSIVPFTLAPSLTVRPRLAISPSTVPAITTSELLCKFPVIVSPALITEGSVLFVVLVWVSDPAEVPSPVSPLSSCLLNMAFPPFYALYTITSAIIIEPN